MHRQGELTSCRDIVPVTTWGGGVAYAIRRGSHWLHPSRGRLVRSLAPYTFACAERAEEVARWPLHEQRRVVLLSLTE